MANVFQFLPDIEGEELSYLQMLLAPLNDEKAMQFSMMYRARRKDPQMILVLTLLGFLGISGVQRFVIQQPGMGLLYFFTGGLCCIGTIIDLVNYRRLAAEYNQKQAYEVAQIMQAMGGM